jgi:lipopolysaccharide export system permease protein
MKLMLYKLDIYIIKKFLGTFFLAILLIICIAVIFDFSEKVDEFMENEAPWKLVIMQYYLNFIPYFAVLFAPLFTFIAVIFFTSRMAYNTEIIAILSSGISFRRILVPYFISATIIMIFNFVLGNYVIPKANAERFKFEEIYYHKSKLSFKESNVHKQIEPGIYIYLKRYYTNNNLGQQFSMEKFENGKLISKLFADNIRWNDKKQKWTINNYYIRNFNGEESTVTTGRSIDTTINLKPEEFSRRDNAVEAMNLNELNRFIENQRLQGAGNIEFLMVEKRKRVAFPFSTYVLTLIGVSVSSRKLRGGIGMQIGIGVVVAFSYLLFMQFSSQYAISGALSPTVAVWFPNALYGIIAIILYKYAPK